MAPKPLQRGIDRFDGLRIETGPRHQQKATIVQPARIDFLQRTFHQGRDDMLRVRPQPDFSG